jgi:hypothetical protein
MTKPKRRYIILGVLLLLVGAEVGLNAVRVRTAAVKVVNMGDEPIVDLVVVCGDSRAAVERISPSQSVVVRLGGRGKKPLKLSYQQLGNAMSGFEVPDFNPGELSRDGSALVLEIRNNEFTRSHEPDETPGTLGRLGRNVWGWFEEESEPSP